MLGVEQLRRRILLVFRQHEARSWMKRHCNLQTVTACVPRLQPAKWISRELKRHPSTHTHTHSPLCYLLKITKYSVWALPLPQAGHTTQLLTNSCDCLKNIRQISADNTALDPSPVCSLSTHLCPSSSSLSLSFSTSQEVLCLAQGHFSSSRLRHHTSRIQEIQMNQNI